MLILILFLTLVLAACNGNTGQTTTPTSVNQLQSNYDLPSWWNGKTCDKNHYPEASLLTTWRGIQVCGPIPWKTAGRKDVPEDFPGHGVSQLEFECPELIARYLLAAYKLDSQQADGWQVVDTYTRLSGSPFHKVVNDGSIHMAPVEGDVLSYGTSDPGHASIVTSSSVDGNGNGSIDVIEQNVAESGTATLTMTNWAIQHDTYHIGTVASWMTTRNIQTVLGASTTPTPTPTATPTPTPFPTPTPTPTQPTPLLVATPQSFAVPWNNHAASPPCQESAGTVPCDITLKSLASNVVNWTLKIDITPSSGARAGAPGQDSGTLLPGQQMQIRVFFMWCYLGTSGNLRFLVGDHVETTVAWTCH